MVALSDSDRSQIIAEINELHKRRGEDWVRRQADAYLSYYWDDAILFTVEERMTIADLRREIIAVLEAGGGPVSIDLPEVDDIVISSAGDAATTCYPWRARIQSENGLESDRTYYETNVWYRRNETWKIIRMHVTRLSLREVSES